MKKIISIILVALMLTTILASCGGKKGQTLDDIKKSGELVVYTEAGFAPFEFVYNNEVVGVDIAICEEIAKEIGVELVVKDVAFNTILGAIESGKAAIGAAGITITPERAEQVDFSMPYTTSKQYIIVKVDSDIASYADLAGKKIGVQLGTSSDFIISDAINGTEDDDGNHVAGDFEGTGATVSTYANPNLAAVNLEGDKLDAVVTDMLPAQLIVNNSNGAYKCFELVYPDGSLTDESYGLCVAKGNTELMEVINKVLTNLIETGKIDEYIIYYSTEVVAD
ncbi:MAG: transporter substrate-binding domain-containing protein [Ruminococcaceae bacterium]|nr:transporter substrate-binding domain-containing protein [Oscillospiraceae bacterium]